MRTLSTAIASAVLLAGAVSGPAAAQTAQEPRVAANFECGPSPTDPTYVKGSGANAAVLSSAGAPGGKTAIAGSFTSFNGTSRAGVARFNSDGSLDSTFTPGTGPSDMPGGGTGTVHAVAVQPDGKILVGGSFGKFAGASNTFRLARLNTNGTVDTTFATNYGKTPLDASVFGITTIRVLASGKILIAGGFNNLGTNARRGMARLNTDGSLDTGFAPAGTGFGANGTGGTSTVFSATEQSDGKILAGGNFASFNGTARSGIVRLTSTGALDTTFTPGSGVPVPSTFDGVNGIALDQSSGKIFISGSFTTYNGVARNRAARLNTNGTLDTTFSVGAGFGPTRTNDVIAAGGLMAYTGLYSSYDNNAASSLALLDATSGAFDSLRKVGNFNWETNGAIYDAANKTLTVTGDFTSYHGSPVGRVARLSLEPCIAGIFDAGPTIPDPTVGVAVKATDLYALGQIWTPDAPKGWTLTWQWLVDGSPISGATNQSHTPSAAQAGKQLTVKATVRNPKHPDAIFTSNASKPVANGTLPTSIGTITVDGANLVGALLTANVPSNTYGASAGWQWLANGSPISGATSRIFTPTAAQAGKKLTVRATLTATGYNQLATSADVGTTGNGVLADGSARPTISGAPTPGATLTANPPLYAAPASTSWQWRADGTPLNGGTGSTLAITPQLAGKRISVTATATATGYDTWTATSASTDTVGGYLSIDPGKIPAISGAPKVGQELAIDVPPDLFTPTPDSVRTVWLANGENTKETGSRYAPGPSDAGKTISVQIIASAANQDPASVVTDPVGPVANGTITTFGSARVTGNPQVGATLLVDDRNYAADPEDARTYQWLADDTPIPGAVEKSFTVGDRLIGAKISAEVNSTATGYDPASTRTSQVGPVRGRDFELAELVLPRSQVGRPSTVDSAFSPEPESVDWVWRADGEPIAAADGPEYTPAAADAGKRLQAEATVRLPGYETTTVASNTVTVAKGRFDAVALTVRGAPIPGVVLAADVTGTEPKPDAVDWQWQRNGEDIPGATTNSYELSSGDIGKIITVTANLSKDGYFDATAFGAAGNDGSGDGSGLIEEALPGTPARPLVLAGDSKLTVSTIGSRPRPGGMPNYEFVASPGGASCTIPSFGQTCEITGLTNGVAYTVTARAKNPSGLSGVSEPSHPAIPGAPGAPGKPGALPGPGLDEITVTALVGTGGTPETTVFVLTGDNGAETTCTAAFPDTGCTATVPDPAQTYTVTATASNPAGTSPTSPPSDPVKAGKPSPPTVTAAGGPQYDQITVSLTPGDGGTPTHHTVTAVDANGTTHTCTAYWPTTSCLLDQLDPSSSYQISATAANALGTSAPASAGSLYPGANTGLPLVVVTEGPLPGELTVTVNPGPTPGTTITATATGVQGTPGGGTCTITHPAAACTITGLRPDGAYAVSLAVSKPDGTIGTVTPVGPFVPDGQNGCASTSSITWKPSAKQQRTGLQAKPGKRVKIAFQVFPQAYRPATLERRVGAGKWVQAGNAFTGMDGRGKFFVKAAKTRKVQQWRIMAPATHRAGAVTSRVLKAKLRKGVAAGRIPVRALPGTDTCKPTTRVSAPRVVSANRRGKATVSFAVSPGGVRDIDVQQRVGRVWKVRAQAASGPDGKGTAVLVRGKARPAIWRLVATRTPLANPGTSKTVKVR